MNLYTDHLFYKIRLNLLSMADLRYEYVLIVFNFQKIRAIMSPLSQDLSVQLVVYLLALSIKRKGKRHNTLTFKHSYPSHSILHDNARATSQGNRTASRGNESWRPGQSSSKQDLSNISCAGQHNMQPATYQPEKRLLQSLDMQCHREITHSPANSL